MQIGRVVKSNSHTDYVCRVYDQADRVPAPQPADFPFAGFVRLGDAVGVIYRSELLNPDYGFHGPRLSVTDSIRAVITPDLINEQAILVGILLLGEETAGRLAQGVPLRVVPIHAEVELLDDAAFLAFHRPQPGPLQVSYYPHLLNQTGPMGPALLLAILDRLGTMATADEQILLGVLRTTVSWQATLGQR